MSQCPGYSQSTNVKKNNCCIQANIGVFGSSGSQNTIKILFDFYQNNLIAYTMAGLIEQLHEYYSQVEKGWDGSIIRACM